MKQEVLSMQYQAKVLGELFKSYGVKNITPVPSVINYKFAIHLMKLMGDKHEKHISK